MMPSKEKKFAHSGYPISFRKGWSHPSAQVIVMSRLDLGAERTSNCDCEPKIALWLMQLETQRHLFASARTVPRRQSEFAATATRRRIANIRRTENS
jgi:hypothetical protein